MTSFPVWFEFFHKGWPKDRNLLTRKPQSALQPARGGAALER
jgi:hypothetical protein